MARAIASVNVSFGLVSIPVKIYTPTKSETKISFKMLRGTDNSRVKQQYIAVNDGAVVARKEMVKGYEYAKDQFVVISDEEVEAVQLEATRAIEITEFVPISQIDPIYFDKPYYLGPDVDRKAEKHYVMLKNALLASGLAAVAQYAARGKQYLVVLRATDQGLVMEQLRYAEEIRTFDEVPMGDEQDVSEAELQLALQIIAMTTSEAFDPTQYSDTVRAAMRAAIDRKIEGQEITILHVEEPRAQVVDLMAALKASLARSMAEKAGRKEPHMAEEAATEQNEQIDKLEKQGTDG
ncbi:MAG: DNA end-binding protein Ku [Myxococcota bacterium]|jgi:DNA end-binding protein Ku